MEQTTAFPWASLDGSLQKSLQCLFSSVRGELRGWTEPTAVMMKPQALSTEALPQSSQAALICASEPGVN